MEKCLKQIVDLQTEKNERKKQRNFVHLMKKCSEYALNGIDYKHCKTMKKTSKSFLSDAIRAIFSIIKSTATGALIFDLVDVIRFLLNDLQTITENDVLSNGILKFVHAFVLRLRSDRSGDFVYDDVDAIVSFANEIIGHSAVKVETGSEEFQDLVHLLVESSSIASIGGGIDNTDPYCKGKGANYCMSLIFAIAKCFRVNKLQISAKTMKDVKKLLICSTKDASI